MRKDEDSKSIQLSIQTNELPRHPIRNTPKITTPILRCHVSSHIGANVAVTFF